MTRWVEWVDRASSRSTRLSGVVPVVAERVAGMIIPRPGFTVAECLEALAEFLLTDPTLR